MSLASSIVNEAGFSQPRLLPGYGFQLRWQPTAPTLLGLNNTGEQKWYEAIHGGHSLNVFIQQTLQHLLDGHVVLGFGDRDTVLTLVWQGSQCEANTLNYTGGLSFHPGLLCCNTTHLSSFP